MPYCSSQAPALWQILLGDNLRAWHPVLWRTYIDNDRQFICVRVGVEALFINHLQCYIAAAGIVVASLDQTDSDSLLGPVTCIHALTLTTA